MSAPIDPIAVLDSQIADLRASGDTGNVENLLAVRDAFAAALATLDDIGGLCRALRQGGPDPMDLQGLSDALTEAVDMAHNALARCGATP